MSLIPPGVLADLQRAVNSALPDTCSNSRTGATTPCYLTDERELRLEGLPRFFPLQRWRIRQPFGTDTQVLDLLTVTDMGTGATNSYLVLLTVNPRSYATSMESHAVLSAPPTIATTQRRAGVPTLGSTSGDTAHLTTLNLYPVGGYLLRPKSEQWVHETFGTNVGQVFEILAGWPDASAFIDASKATEDHPVQVHDTLTIGQTSYDVLTVENWAPTFISIYVTVPAP